MSYYKTNIKCQENFDILKMLRGKNSEHIKKGSCTIPITVNGTHGKIHTYFSGSATSTVLGHVTFNGA